MAGMIGVAILVVPIVVVGTFFYVLYRIATGGKK